MKNRILILVTVILSFLFIVSCNEEGPVEPDPTIPPNTLSASGSINSDEIGGDALKVVSAYQDEANVSNNQYNTTVSGRGTQVLFILDNNSKLRGLTLSKLVNSKPEILTFDAKSTVLGLLFLTPGIATPVTSETESRINELTALSNFQNFIEYLKTNLKTKSLDQVLNDTAGKTLFNNIVSEYYYSKVDTTGNKPISVLILKNLFEVNKITTGTTTKIELKNWAYRRVDVYKREIKTDFSQKSLNEIYPQMNGGMAISWGSIITGSVWQPTVNIDTVYNPDADVFKTEYWVLGLGLKPSNDSPPATININIYDASGQTILYYLAFPIIDMITGTQSLFNTGSSTFRAIWAVAQNGYINHDQVMNATNSPQLGIAVVNSFVSITGLLLVGGSSGILVSLGIVSAPVAATIGVIVGYISATMGLSNVGCFVIDMTRIQRYTKFDIYNEGANSPPNEPSNPNPLNGATNQSINIDLSWTGSDPENDPLTYDIYFGTNSNPPLVKSNHTVTNYNLGTLDNSTQYFWKIVASDGQLSTLGPTWNFTTTSGGTAPLPPVLSSPTNGSTNVSLPTTLGWNASSGASSYTMQVSTNNSFSNLVYNQNVGNVTSKQISGLNNSTKYYWRVSATNGYGTSGWSSVWNFTTEGGGGGEPCPGIPTVTYAGKTYNTVQIGTQCWLKENLDVGSMINSNEFPTDNGIIEKWCYNDDPYNCATYGGLYHWNETLQYSTAPGVQGICPPGWYIPTLTEFVNLSYVVGEDGNALKAIGQGSGGGAGTNTSGFSALLAGDLSGGLNTGASFWSSSGWSSSHSNKLFLHNASSKIDFLHHAKWVGISVRCLRD